MTPKYVSKFCDLPASSFNEHSLISSEVKLRGLILNFYIHAFVSDLYIPMIGPRQTHRGNTQILYINRSQIHKCGNWETVSFLGKHKSDQTFILDSHQPLICSSCPPSASPHLSTNTASRLNDQQPHISMRRHTSWVKLTSQWTASTVHELPRPSIITILPLHEHSLLGQLVSSKLSRGSLQQPPPVQNIILPFLPERCSTKLSTWLQRQKEDGI